MFLPDNDVSLGRSSCLHLSGLDIVTVTVKGLGLVCSVGHVHAEQPWGPFTSEMSEGFCRDGDPAPLHAGNPILYHGML